MRTGKRRLFSSPMKVKLLAIAFRDLNTFPYHAFLARFAIVVNALAPSKFPTTTTGAGCCKCYDHWFSRFCKILPISKSSWQVSTIKYCKISMSRGFVALTGISSPNSTSRRNRRRFLRHSSRSSVLASLKLLIFLPSASTMNNNYTMDTFNIIDCIVMKVKSKNEQNKRSLKIMLSDLLSCLSETSFRCFFLAVAMRFCTF